MNTTVAIVIPVYKEILTRSEKKSLDQCFKIFPSRTLIFFAPEGLNLQDYQIEDRENCNTVFFDAKFFANVAGYNKLMLSKQFYRKFAAYQFILIYQLDAWAFSDKLDHWCAKDYAYVGAPWFENFSENSDTKNLWAVGNGGFSLRKTTDFIQVLDSKKSIFSFSYLWSKYKEYPLFNKLLRLPKIILQFYCRNNTNHLYELFGENEDHFWSFHAKEIINDFTVAPVQEALSFAFECNPKRMYELNGEQLPFGIHAWEKYDYTFVEKVMFNQAK